MQGFHTPVEENILQGTWTPEQTASHRVRQRYMQEVYFAQDVSRRLLGKLQAIHEDKGWQKGLQFAGETEYWEAYIVLLGVVPTHRDYCLRLFQAVAYERYQGWIERLTKGQSK